MGSSGKKRTTMAKLNREGKLREKRFEKEARKAARKMSAASDAEAGSGLEDLGGDSPELRGGGLDDGASELVAAVRDVAAG